MSDTSDTLGAVVPELYAETQAVLREIDKELREYVELLQRNGVVLPTELNLPNRALSLRVLRLLLQYGWICRQKGIEKGRTP